MQVLQEYIESTKKTIHCGLGYLDPYAQKCCEPSENENSASSNNIDVNINYVNFYVLPSVFVVQSLIYVLTSGFTAKLYLYLSLINILMFAIFALSCRDYPEIYKYSNSILMALIGPIAVLSSDQYIFFSMATAFVLPLFSYILHQKQFCTALVFVSQYLLFNLFYIPKYIDKVEMLSSESLKTFLLDQFDIINQVIILNGSFMLILFFMLKSSKPNNSNIKTKSDNEVSPQFLYKFSHELRNPLNSMLGNLEMAVSENNDSRVSELLSNARVCGELLSQLISNILDSGKMDFGGIELNEKIVNIYEVMEKIWGVSSEMIKKKGLNGKLIIQKKVPQFLFIDSARIIQIMLNLVRNAVRFTEKGSIKISITWIENERLTPDTFQLLSTESADSGADQNQNINFNSNSTSNQYVLDSINKKIKFELTQKSASKGMLRIVVSDTGCGMDEERVRKVFTRFPEINSKSNNKKEKSATGLNMYITRQICEKMGGDIRVSSKSKTGTNFVLCIKPGIPPADAGNLELNGSHGNSNSNQASAPEKKMRGLVIDDNPYNSELNKRYLERNHVTVISCAKNGMEALEIYKHEVTQNRKINIITIDLDMPLFDGKSACEKIREFEASANVPPSNIIIISGNCFEADVKECLDVSGKIKANYFIRKPIYYSDFQKLIVAVQANLVEENTLENFKPKKVLIVDDDSFNRQILTKILMRENVEFLEAKNGSEAVEVYQAEWRDIGLIFMDCEMPIMNGFGATKNIRAYQNQKKLPKIKIYGLSGHRGSEFNHECKEAGMDSTVTKPFRMEDVSAIVNTCMREYK